MSRKISFPEIAWLTTIILVLAAAVHSTLYNGWKQSLVFYILLLVAVLFYLLRRRLRIRKNESRAE